MKKWEKFTIMSVAVIIVCVFDFTACDDSNGNNSNNNNPAGGTLVVNNGTSYTYSVTITFDGNKVFAGRITSDETIRITSGEDVEYKIFLVRQAPYTSSRIGSLSGEQTIYFNIGYD